MALCAQKTVSECASSKLSSFSCLLVHKWFKLIWFFTLARFKSNEQVIHLHDYAALDRFSQCCWVRQSLFLSLEHRRNDKIISVGLVFILFILKVLKGIMVFVCAFKDSLSRHCRYRAVYLFLFVEAYIFSHLFLLFYTSLNPPLPQIRI